MCMYEAYASFNSFLFFIPHLVHPIIPSLQ